jgi:hypothetical protein
MTYNGVTKTESGYEAFYVKNGNKAYIGHFYSDEMAARAVDATIGRPFNFQDLWTLEQILTEDNKRRIKEKGYRGVYLHKKTGKWEAAIKVDGKRISIGYFPSKELAAIAYDKQAKLVRGEKTKLNFPEVV